MESTLNASAKTQLRNKIHLKKKRQFQKSHSYIVLLSQADPKLAKEIIKHSPQFVLKSILEVVLRLKFFNFVMDLYGGVGKGSPILMKFSPIDNHIK